MGKELRNLGVKIENLSKEEEIIVKARRLWWSINKFESVKRTLTILPEERTDLEDTIYIIHGTIDKMSPLLLKRRKDQTLRWLRQEESCVYEEGLRKIKGHELKNYTAFFERENTTKREMALDLYQGNKVALESFENMSCVANKDIETVCLDYVRSHEFHDSLERFLRKTLKRKKNQNKYLFQLFDEAFPPDIDYLRIGEGWKLHKDLLELLEHDEWINSLEELDKLRAIYAQKALPEPLNSEYYNFMLCSMSEELKAFLSKSNDCFECNLILPRAHIEYTFRHSPQNAVYIAKHAKSYAKNRGLSLLHIITKYRWIKGVEYYLINNKAG